MDEQLLSEVLRKLNLLLDEKNGIKTSGMGMLANNTDKANEIADKSQKFLYFLEARSKRMEEVQLEILKVLKEKLK